MRGLAGLKPELFSYSDKVEEKYHAISPQELELWKATVTMYMGMSFEDAEKDTALLKKLADIEKKWNE